MYKYVVDNVEQITATTLLVNLTEKEGERLFSFQPGQYAAISFFSKGRPTAARCFSMVSSPTDQTILQFSMRSKGHYTKALASLVKGDIVNVRGPYGGFVLDLAHDSNVMFLAGGIGITPFMSMASYAAKAQAANKITLVYSCQSQDDIPFLAELTKLQHQNTNFKVIYAISKGPVDKLVGQSVTSGRITPEVLETALTSGYGDTTFYICGPPPFMKGMVSTLQSKGAPQNHIMTEAFAQGPHHQTGQVRSWPNNIYIFSAIAVVLSSFVVMVGDLFKTLPPSALIGTSNVTTKAVLTNSRQADLDALVNALPVSSGGAPESDSVKAAILASGPSAKVTTPVQKTTTSAPTNTPNKSASTTPTPTPAPAPAPKKCTTTQSGVTTCV